MRFELYNQREHFPIVFDWWKKHREAVIDIEALGATGILAYDDMDHPVAATWLFFTNAKLACMGWTVSNPEMTPQVIAEALGGLATHCEDLAKKNGYTRLMCFSSSTGLSSFLERMDFTKLIAHDLLIKAVS